MTKMPRFTFIFLPSLMTAITTPHIWNLPN